MKICKNCGSELNENEKFCPNCGVSQEEYSAVQYPDIQQDTDSHDAAYSAENDSPDSYSTEGYSTENYSTAGYSTDYAADSPADYNYQSYPQDSTYYPAQQSAPSYYQQDQGANYYGGGAPIQQPQISEHNLPAKYKPVSAWGYIGYNILFGIPIVGLILAIVFAVSDKKINRRNYARAQIIIVIISIVLMVIFYFLIRDLAIKLISYFEYLTY